MLQKDNQNFNEDSSELLTQQRERVQSCLSELVYLKQSKQDTFQSECDLKVAFSTLLYRTRELNQVLAEELVHPVEVDHISCDLNDGNYFLSLVTKNENIYLAWQILLDASSGFLVIETLECFQLFDPKTLFRINSEFKSENDQSINVLIKLSLNAHLFIKSRDFCFTDSFMQSVTLKSQVKVINISVKRNFFNNDPSYWECTFDYLLLNELKLSVCFISQESRFRARPPNMQSAVYITDLKINPYISAFSSVHRDAGSVKALKDTMLTALRPYFCY